MSHAMNGRDHAEAVCALTDAYLDHVTDATAGLPDALDAYGTDPEAFAVAVQRVAARESACDATLRDLRALVGESTPPNDTELYLRMDEVARLYAAIDEVPNRAERFVRELDAIDPALSEDRRIALREMAALTDEAARKLARLAARFVECLVTDADPVPVVETAEELAELESACDRLKYDVLDAAFDDLPTADALVVRELVLTLDAAMDAVEDASEQLLFVNSTDR